MEKAISKLIWQSDIIYLSFKLFQSTLVKILILLLRTINSGQGQMKMDTFLLTMYVLVTIISMHGSLVSLEIIAMMLMLT